MRLKSAVLSLFITAASSFSSSPSLVGTSTVQVNQAAHTVTIHFTASEFVDVTVNIADSMGKIIRHLASGKLGPNPPAPLTPNSLSQSLPWDMKDDGGLGFDGTVKVNIQLGLYAVFDTILAWDPDNLMHQSGYPMGIAADKQGNVIVKAAWGNFNPTHMYVYGRDGKYLRTLNPYPGDFPESELKGYPRLTLAGGKKAPTIFAGKEGQVMPQFQGCYNASIALGKNGELITVSHTKSLVGVGGLNRRLLIMKADGSCPMDSFLGPVIIRYTEASGTQVVGFVSIALAPDSNTVYISGPDNVIRTALLNSQADAQPFVSGFVNNKGVAVDKQGNIYVADSTLNRVYVLNASGAKLDSVGIKGADQLLLNPATGELYATSLNNPVFKVIKFTAYPALDSVSSWSTSWSYTSRPPNLTGDFSTSTPRLWMGPMAATSVCTGLDDMGSSFVKTALSIGQKNSKPFFSSGNWGSNGMGPGYFAVDPEERFLYAGWRTWTRYNLRTGTATASKIVANEVTFGADGYLYTWGNGTNGAYGDTAIRKYDINETRVNFAGGDSVIYTRWNKFKSGLSSRGIRVARNGDVYVANVYVLANEAENVDVHIIGQDGVIKRKVLASYDSCRGAISGIGVDPSGNLFVGNNMRPKGIPYSDAFDGAGLPAPGMYWNAPAINHYGFFNGAIFKFSPAGGTFERKRGITVASLPNGSLSGPVPELQPNGFYNMTMEVKGATWQHLGFAPCPAPLGVGADDRTCHCVTGRFAVDDYGRVFVPEALNFQVAVLDNNKNVLLKFGEYGNMDQQGPRSARPTPEIPLGYPAAVQTAGNSVYVADMSNLRVVRVKLTPRAEWQSTGSVVHGFSAIEEKITVRGPITIQVYPTPFNPATTIRIGQLPGHQLSGRTIDLTIYDLQGRLIESQAQKSGASECTFTWNAKHQPSGLYYAVVTVGDRRLATRMILAK